jgi:hypothetical protein
MWYPAGYGIEDHFPVEFPELPRYMSNHMTPTRWVS